ncbi:MAG: hypothetical protein GWP34_05590 [Alphaproteobacteria bacterium]|nr:hypothetical protein [Alphaproteobacteria bacterium]
MSETPTLPLEALSLSITQCVVCSKCADELAHLNPPQSLQDYAAMDVGFTEYGVQVWCRRHKANIVHIDFQGAKLPADFRRLETS